MNSQTKIQTILNKYQPYFHITPLCEGLQYSLKCIEDKTVSEYKPRKLEIYQDTPLVLCFTCSGGNKLKTFSVIKKGASKAFNLISEKSDFLQKNGTVTISCKKANHIIDTTVVVKYCQQCSDQESQVYITKRMSKNLKINTSLMQQNLYVLCVKSLSQINMIEALKHLISSGSLLKEKRNIIIEKNKFKRFNIRKVLEAVNVKYIEEEHVYMILKETVNTTVEKEEPEKVEKHMYMILEEPEKLEKEEPEKLEKEEHDNDEDKQQEPEKVEKHMYMILEEPVNTTVEKEEHDDDEDKQQELNIEDFLRECNDDIERLDKLPIIYNDNKLSEIPVEDLIKESNYNIESDKINSIFNKPQNYDNDIDVKVTYEEFLSVFDDHNSFMNDYYKNLQKCGPVFNTEKSKKDYIIFKKSCDKKYYEFDPVMNNQICYRQNYACHNIGEKYVNHSFNDYMKSLNTNGHFKDFYSNQVYTPSPIHSILHKTFTDNSCLVDVDVIDVDSLEISEIIENKTELAFVHKVINIVKQVKKEVSLFYMNNGYKHKLILLLKKIETLYEEDYTLTDLTIRELLVSNCSKEDLSIDPVIIVTIILCLNNAHSYPFNVYYNKNKSIVYDSENRLYIRKQKDNNEEHILLSKRAAQKILYIDSGVATLFWKLVFSQSSLDKFELYSFNPCKFFEICPDHMFDLDAIFTAGHREKNINIVGYIDCSYDFAEFMHELFPQENSYYKRSLITRAIIIMTSKGVTNHIKCKVNEFLQKYMSPKTRHTLLNSEEEDLLEYYNETLGSYLITSEVKNIFSKQILKPENVKSIGTILKPNLGKHRIYTKEETLSPEFVVDIYKRM